MKKPSDSTAVRITKEAKNKLSILAKRNEKTELDYVSHAITFIYKSGIDVYTKVAPNIPDLVKNLENRIIGFMKKRESDFFVPMNEKMVALTDSHVKLFDALEAFDVVKFASGQEEKKGPSFKIPDEQKSFKTGDLKLHDPEKNIALEKDQNEAEKFGNIVDQNNREFEVQKEVIYGELEKVKKQRDFFKNELLFLMGKISKGGALGGGRFMLNITQRDYDRIKKILDDN